MQQIQQHSGSDPKQIQVIHRVLCIQKIYIEDEDYLKYFDLDINIHYIHL